MAPSCSCRMAACARSDGCARTNAVTDQEPMYEAESGEMRIALLGDTTPAQRLAGFRESRYLAIRDVLAGADAVFTNLEAPVHRYLDLPQAQRAGGGTYMTAEPHLLE